MDLQEKLELNLNWGKPTRGYASRDLLIVLNIFYIIETIGPFNDVFK